MDDPKPTLRPADEAEPHVAANPFSEGPLPHPFKDDEWDGPDHLFGEPGEDGHDIALLVRQVMGRFNHLQTQQLRTNKALYELLGLIYQANGNMDGDEVQRACIYTHGSHIIEREQWIRWTIPSKRRTVAEMLVAMVLTLAPERKVTRHQWNGALKAAENAAVEPTERAFVEWIERVGGIVAANKLLAASDDDEDDDQGDDSNDDGEGDGRDHPTGESNAIERLLRNLPTMSKSAPTITLMIDPANEAREKLTAALLTPLTDESGAPTGEMRVLKRSNDERLLKLFAEIALPKGKLLTPKEVRKLADKLITRLNLFAIDVGTHPRGRMKPSRCLSFIKAVEKLGELDCEGVYFTEPPVLSLKKIDDGKHGHSELTVVNPGFHPLDPARYIGNAKEGALLGYKLKGPTVRECREEIGEYVHSLRTARRPVADSEASPEQSVRRQEMEADVDVEAVHD